MVGQLRSEEEFSELHIQNKPQGSQADQQKAGEKGAVSE